MWPKLTVNDSTFLHLCLRLLQSTWELAFILLFLVCPFCTKGQMARVCTTLLLQPQSLQNAGVELKRSLRSWYHLYYLENAFPWALGLFPSPHSGPLVTPSASQSQQEAKHVGERVAPWSKWSCTHVWGLFSPELSEQLSTSASSSFIK